MAEDKRHFVVEQTEEDEDWLGQWRRSQKPEELADKVAKLIEEKPHLKPILQPLLEES